MTLSIELPRGRVALIDDSDWPVVRSYGWWIAVSRSRCLSLEYARGYTRGERRQPLMHNLLTGWALVDHVNGDGLDNRRVNLRPATRSQNQGNRRKFLSTASQYKGVTPWAKDKARWIAVCRRKKVLGVFNSEAEAALAYDAAARQEFGEYAALNFPGPGERSALTGALRAG